MKSTVCTPLRLQVFVGSLELSKFERGFFRPYFGWIMQISIFGGILIPPKDSNPRITVNLKGQKYDLLTIYC